MSHLSLSQLGSTTLSYLPSYSSWLNRMRLAHVSSKLSFLISIRFLWEWSQLLLQCFALLASAGSVLKEV